MYSVQSMHKEMSTGSGTSNSCYLCLKPGHMRRNYGAYIAHTDRQFADNAQASGEEKREVGAKPKSRSIRAS